MHAQSTATSYAPTTSGGDTFTDSGSQNTTTGGDTNNDAINNSDRGSDSFAASISGGGSSHTYAMDDSTNANFNDRETDTATTAAGTTTDGDVYTNSDTGTDARTYQEQGSLAADGTTTLLSFTDTDVVTDTAVAAETNAAQEAATAANAPTDLGTQTSTASDTATGTATTTVSGNATSWTLSETDQYSDDFSNSASGNETTDNPGTSGADNGETTSSSTSDSGHDSQTLSVQATGSDAGVTITSMQLSISGRDGFTQSGNDATNATAAPSAAGLTADASMETVSSTAKGFDNFTLSVTGSDGAGYAVSEKENLSDNYTDGDKGGDIWDDPNAGGTEAGADSYQQSDVGQETAAVTTTGTLDAGGNFTLTGFHADRKDQGNATTKDSGNDNVAVVGETDGAVYTDNSQGTDNREVVLDQSGNATTATITDTISGEYKSGDANTDNWGNGTVPAGQDVEVVKRTDDNIATVVSNQTGTLDAAGNLQVANASITVDGTDKSSEDDRTNVEEEEQLDPYAAPADEDVVQDDTTTGTDACHVATTLVNGVLASLSDKETIADTVKDTVAINPESGSGPDVGSSTLSGTVDATTTQTGTTVAGQLTLAPPKGNDTVALTGGYKNTTVEVTDGTDPSTGAKFWTNTTGCSAFDFAEDGLDAATSATITTKLSDDALTMNESDSAANGTTTIESINFSDAPSVTVAAIITYTPGSGMGGNGAVTEVRVTTESDSETVSKSGGVDSVTQTTSQTGNDTVGGCETFTAVPANSWTSGWISTKATGTASTVHTLTGTVGPGGANLTETDRVNSEQDVTQSSNAYITNPLNIAYSYKGTAFDDDKINTTTVERLTGNASALLDFSGETRTDGNDRRVTSSSRGTETDNLEYHLRSTQNLVNNQPQVLNSASSIQTSMGNSPMNGANATYDSRNPPSPKNSSASGDWFSQLTDFSAAVSDKVSFGLTKSIRKGLDIDAVNYNSPAYKNGAIAGEVLSTAVQFATPCGSIGVMRGLIRGVHGVQSVGQGVGAAQSFQQGDIASGLLQLAGARASYSSMLKSCFETGTLMMVPDGLKAIETFAPGDWILSRNEHDPDGPLVPRQVLNVFIRVSPILLLNVRGRIIGTTGEHPFHVEGRGWIRAGSLNVGDILLSDDGQRIEVEGVADSDRVATVYNLEVEDDHTYFVGGHDWGFSVWSHNATCVPTTSTQEGRDTFDRIFKNRVDGVATLSKTKHPASAQHILDAQKAGHPEVLTIYRSGADANRAASLAGKKKVAGHQLDEYPPAMFREGGAGASVRAIPSADNMGAGASLGNQLRGFLDGARIQVKVVN